jgi:integrase/recombinase XerD
MGIGIISFLEDCRSRGLTKHTIETYRSNVTAYLDFVGDPLKADTPHLWNFLNYLREDVVYTVGMTRKKGVSPRTLSAYFSAISSYYDYLIYEGTLNKNSIPPFRKRYLANNRPKTNIENTWQLISIYDQHLWNDLIEKRVKQQ